MVKKRPSKKKKQNKVPSFHKSLTWQGALKLLENRVFKIRSPRGHGTGFHVGNFGKNRKLCTIATAYHVVQAAHDWGESIKVIHSKTGKEVLLREADRVIFTYAKKDLAIILFNLPVDLTLPTDQIDLIPTGKYLIPGVDVAWCGFPAIRNDQLCFFHGFISCYIDQDGDYLIDGVAINGVSGGPVFYIDDTTNKPKIAGVITAYIANRATGETLPGVSMITSVAPYEETIRNLDNLDQAAQEADKQKTSEEKTPEELRNT